MAKKTIFINSPIMKSSIEKLYTDTLDFLKDLIKEDILIDLEKRAAILGNIKEITHEDHHLKGEFKSIMKVIEILDSMKRISEKVASDVVDKFISDDLNNFKGSDNIH